MKDLEYSNVMQKKSWEISKVDRALEKRGDPTTRTLRVSILGPYEVLGLDECLVYSFSSPEEIK